MNPKFNVTFDTRSVIEKRLECGSVKNMTSHDTRVFVQIPSGEALIYAIISSFPNGTATRVYVQHPRDPSLRVTPEMFTNFRRLFIEQI